jgi:hypothetical protein
VLRDDVRAITGKPTCDVSMRWSPASRALGGAGRLERCQVRGVRLHAVSVERREASGPLLRAAAASSRRPERPSDLVISGNHLRTGAPQRRPPEQLQVVICDTFSESPALQFHRYPFSKLSGLLFLGNREAFAALGSDGNALHTMRVS